MKLPLHARMFLAVLIFVVPVSAPAQSTPNVPDQYKRFFFQYSDQRQFYEKALNSIGLTSLPVGRSYALIAGVAQYPNLPEIEQSLKPAAVDIEKLKSYLKEQEFFDEIVVLKDSDMNLENLNYFLQNYFPDKLAHSPHSRFLFAYSGHGYADKGGEMARGFLLKSAATSKTDPVNRIDLSVLRTMLDPDVESAEKVLVLINACQSGAFLGRKPFGGVNPLAPGDRGAHAIMASRTNQSSFQLAAVGPGSVFFEKLFAGLEGAADNAPRDGVVTYHELVTYLRSEVPYVTNNSQIPLEGDISRNGSVGEFFFLNRSRQVQLGNVKPWNPGDAVAFGEPASDVLEEGRSAYRAKRYEAAFSAYRRAAEAGNVEAMTSLGYLYDSGDGVAQDYQKARQWYEKGAEAGDARAMTHLGYLYEDGHGVARHYQKARQWFEKGAEAGDARAMAHLGYLYDSGRRVAQDYQQARQWYEKAMNAGDGTAWVTLADMYRKGKGGPQDCARARALYEKNGGGGAIWLESIGDMYYEGCGGSVDYEQARLWYQKAFEKGAPSLDKNYVARIGDPNYITGKVLYRLGYMYEHGQSVPIDHQQARRWYEKAAAAPLTYDDPDIKRKAEERLKALPN